VFLEYATATTGILWEQVEKGYERGAGVRAFGGAMRPYLLVGLVVKGRRVSFQRPRIIQTFLSGFLYLAFGQLLPVQD
jgi:hypothetical protein